MQFVPVRGSDRKMVVDDQDYELVAAHDWVLGDGEIVTKVEGRGYVPVAAVVLGWEDRKARHLDKDIFNARRHNFVLLNHNGNVKGVVRSRNTVRGHVYDKWKAQLRVDGRQITLGWADTEDEARRIYLDKAPERRRAERK